ncbi:MAG TPA: AI-2E family transporter [Steroidobacteraceae bacterium]|nr:AI-2E family transporter [Steroidobacteraceae bacterium]
MILPPPTVSPSQLTAASYILMAAGLVLVLHLHLLSAVLVGLLVYSLVGALAPGLQRHLPGTGAHWVVVAVLAALVVGVVTLVILAGIAFLNSQSGNPTKILERLMPVIERARLKLPSIVTQNLPENVEETRATILAWMREHAAQLQLAGKHAVRIVVQLLVGIVLGAMLAIHRARMQPRRGPLAELLNMRCANLVTAFHDVVFAQVKISALNTLLTGIFLLVALPLFGVHMPLAKALVVLTFIAGLLPVIGNLISNTVIFVVGLSLSVGVAITALAYLILIHKLEYFLNARIIGTQIRARAWELLIAMLVMEAIFGAPGLIAAPIYYAYMKRELEAARLI